MNSTTRCIAALAFIAASLCSPLGFANVTYTYTGSNFTNVVDDPSVPGSYDASMRISGTFELGNPLPPNRSLNDDNVAPLSFSFGDGRSVITNASPALNVQVFRIATDAAGNITQWNISLISQPDLADFEIQTRSVQSGGSTGQAYDQGSYRVDTRVSNDDYAYTSVAGSWGNSAIPSLSFALKDCLADKPCTADTAPINSVFDHSMRNRQNGIAPYQCDGRVIAYTGEVGLLEGWPITSPNCANQPGYSHPSSEQKAPPKNPFTVNGTYTGANQPWLLNYDGHAGIDYRASMSTPVYAVISGTVSYPMSIVGARDGRAYYTFHTLELAPDGFPDYRIYYLHLSSHELDNAKTKNDTTPSCPSTETFPLVSGAHINAGCLIALSGQAGTCKDGNCAPHLHIEVQRRIPLANLGATRSRVQENMTCPDDATMACIPVDPYGWTGTPTDCIRIGDFNTDPANPKSNTALGDYYECDTGIRSVRLWK